MRTTLTVDQQKAADMVSQHAICLPEEYIRPINVDDKDQVKTVRAIGLAIWQEREAFVSFFSTIDPDFNDALFREECRDKP